MPVGRTALGRVTRRELDVLSLVSRGLGSRAIGVRLGISRFTVDSIVSSAMARLGAGTRIEAALLAVDSRARKTARVPEHAQRLEDADSFVAAGHAPTAGSPGNAGGPAAIEHRSADHVETRSPAPGLSEEHHRLLGLLAAGHTVVSAARSLHLSRRTAARRLEAIRARLGVKTTAEAVSAVAGLPGA